MTDREELVSHIIYIPKEVVELYGEKGAERPPNTVIVE